MKLGGKSGHQQQATASKDNYSSWLVVSLAEVTRECRSRNNGQLDDKLLCGVLKSHGLVPMRERVKGDSTDRCKLVAPNAFAYNPMRLNIGSIARNTADRRVMVSPDYVVFQTDPERVLPNYLDHVRYSGLWKSYVGATGDGSVRVRIYYDQLSNFQLPLPPLPEQQKISTILTAVDAKLDVIARQIETTQSLKMGLMKTLFRRGVGTENVNGSWIPHTELKDSELGDIPVGWKVRTLESVATVERGKFSARPRNDPKYFENGDIPFVQTGDIASVPRYIENASQFLNADGLAVSKRFPAGTILITIAANIGDVAIAKIPMTCPDSLVGIKANSDECDNIWLYYQLANNKDYFDSKSTQNAQKNINLQVLKPFLLALPSLTEQHRIAEVLTALDDKLEVLVSRQTQYQTLKRGLMQKLLTGEWRVKLDSPSCIA
ncbi:restriction endonuclease subunit S [Pseudomonas sp. NPDC088368]|uniref:restriction endonuclease subunit S n=1 Tax=Pseudomonas sp. NPDC088368 TaxID=3364453 RepID=UPI003820B267